MYQNLGYKSHAEIEALCGETLRVRVSLPRPWRFQPGQHAYLYLPSISLWMSHPFSVAWSDNDNDEEFMDLEKPKSQEYDLMQKDHNSVYFLIRRRTGMTDTLWKKTIATKDGFLRTPALIEGPYGSQNLTSFGTVMLFAFGVGITHQMPHIRDLVHGYANGTAATRKVLLCWTIQSSDHLEWVQDWLMTIMSCPRRREILRIQIYTTRMENKITLKLPPTGFQLYPGRPNIQAIVDREVERSIGAVGVSCCGVGAAADDVRNACRSWMGKVNIEFQEEAFSW
jgi:hypothetical protein